MEQPDDSVPIATLAATATTLELGISFDDAELASYPEERPREEVLSDSFRIDCGSTSLLCFPFAEGDTKARAWLRRDSSAWEPAATGVRLGGGYDAKAAQWQVSLSVDRSLLGIPGGSEAPFNLSVYDNDLTGFTTAYRWVPKDRPTNSQSGVIDLRKCVR